MSLRSAGFEVRAEPSGSELASAVTTFHSDLAILDLRLPDGEDGFRLAVWGFEGYDDNFIEVHISALRRKLEGRGPRLIHTERGERYVLRPPSPA